MSKQQELPPPPKKLPSKMQLKERERLVAEIKKHHPKAITEGILKHLEDWGGVVYKPRPEVAAIWNEAGISSPNFVELLSSAKKASNASMGA